MALTRGRPGDGDARRVLDLAHALWQHDPGRVNFETSFGTLAWEGVTAGRTRVFERDQQLVGWARLTPGYDRIRRPGVFDRAPASLTWLVDWRDSTATEVLGHIVEWAEERADEPFTTSHPVGDTAARQVLADLGYRPDPTEPFSVYLRQPLPAASSAPPTGYVLTTMAELRDLDLRTEAHRLAWDSARTADDWRQTMATWPYRPDLDVVVTTEDGAPVGSALIWYDRRYRYGEFEPVGVAPDHRGHGVAQAMLRFGLERLAAAGAAQAVVGARGDDDYPGPRHLYRSVGFRPFSVQQVVGRN